MREAHTPLTVDPRAAAPQDTINLRYQRNHLRSGGEVAGNAGDGSDGDTFHCNGFAISVLHSGSDLVEVMVTVSLRVKVQD